MVKKITIPNDFIVEVYEHPEDETMVCATLIDGSYTDLFYDINTEMYYILSNNKELLENIEKEIRKMVQKMKYLTIQSEINVNVTAGLENLDMTDVNANIGDKLKVQPLWPKRIVFISKGRSYYPIEIKEWNTVKALANSGMITIGQEVSELPTNLDENQLAVIMNNFTKLEDGNAEIERQEEALGKVKKAVTEDKKPTLADLRI